MIGLAIILFVILFVCGWILFMPLVIDVDTARTVYQVYQTGTFRFWLEKDFQPQVRVLGIPIAMNQQKQHKAEAKHIKKKRKREISILRIRFLIVKIIQSIFIKRFHVDIDTDDVVTNAQLIPAFLFLSRGPVQLTANYEGRVYASLMAEVRVYRLAWAFLEFFTKK